MTTVIGFNEFVKWKLPLNRNEAVQQNPEKKIVNTDQHRRTTDAHC